MPAVFFSILSVIKWIGKPDSSVGGVDDGAHVRKGCSLSLRAVRNLNFCKEMNPQANLGGELMSRKYLLRMPTP